MKKITHILFLLSITIGCFGQSSDEEIRFWKLSSVSGEFRLKGDYRNQSSFNAGIEDQQQSALLSGGILFRTNSYFWTKKFMILDVDGEFNPETSTDKYLVVPDQAEVRTLARLSISSLFFAQKPVTLNLFTHLDQGYSNRENLTNLRTDHKDFGGMLSFVNRALPGSISYKEGWSNVVEIPGGRTFNTYQKNLLASANKSFGTRDKNELNYSKDYYLTQQFDQSPITVITDNIYMTNSVYFDKFQRYRFNSFISALSQTRSENMKRYQISETFSAKLPERLNLYTNYSLYKYEFLRTKSDQNNLNGRLDHKLYESLNTGIFAEYNDTKHTFYHENVVKSGFDLLYQKKMPAKGMLTLGYKYEHQHHKQISDPIKVQIINEQHLLSDGQIELLDKAYVDISTIVITDITASVFYQLNFDYILMPRNNFIEIQRIPGGQIANNSSVLITYFATQPGSYQYDLNGQNASANLMFFNHFVEIYYRLFRQDFAHLEQTEYLTIDYIKQNFYGVKLEYKIASAGVEYDDYQSTVMPYKMMHYFMTLQGDFSNKVMYSLIGNIRDYNMTADHIMQEYDDLSGNISFPLSVNSHLNLNVAYRNQKGTGIDLKLFTSRLEYTANYRKLFFKVGLDFYRRDYIGEKLYYRGGSVEIARRF